MYENNSKTLDIDKLRLLTSRTTLGFKCDPKLKLKLVQQSQQLGVTLSEYVENIVNNYDPTSNEKMEQLTDKVKFYENNILMDLFEKNMNKTVNFINAKGESINIKIRSWYDVYTLIINSFKTE